MNSSRDAAALLIEELAEKHTRQYGADASPTARRRGSAPALVFSASDADSSAWAAPDAGLSVGRGMRESSEAAPFAGVPVCQEVVMGMQWEERKTSLDVIEEDRPTRKRRGSAPVIFSTTSKAKPDDAPQASRVQRSAVLRIVATERPEARRRGSAPAIFFVATACRDVRATPPAGGSPTGQAASNRGAPEASLSVSPDAPNGGSCTASDAESDSYSAASDSSSKFQLIERNTFLHFISNRREVRRRGSAPSMYFFYSTSDAGSSAGQDVRKSLSDGAPPAGQELRDRPWESPAAGLPLPCVASDAGPVGRDMRLGFEVVEKNTFLHAITADRPETKRRGSAPCLFFSSANADSSATQDSVRKSISDGCSPMVSIVPDVLKLSNPWAASQGGLSLSRDVALGLQWIEKNTFLDVIPTDRHVPRRRGSAPSVAFSTSSDAGSSAGCGVRQAIADGSASDRRSSFSALADISDGSTSVRGEMRNKAFPALGADLPDGHLSDSEESDRELEAVAPMRRDSTSSRSSRKHKRPCRGKRVRYRLLAEQLEQRVLANPQMDLDELHMPQWVVDNPRLEGKLAGRLRKVMSDNAELAGALGSPESAGAGRAAGEPPDVSPAGGASRARAGKGRGRQPSRAAIS